MSFFTRTHRQSVSGFIRLGMALLALTVSASFTTACSKVKLINARKGSLLNIKVAPSITSIAPPSGLFNDQTPITITGTAFLEGAKVYIGDAECTDVVVVSITTITCKTPTGVANTVATVTVVNVDGQTGTLANAYAYLDAVQPVAGFVISAGGGYSAAISNSTGTEIKLQATAGEVGNQLNSATPATYFSEGGAIKLISGVQGVLYEP